MFLLIGNYNNYYNRIVKKQDTLIAYKGQMGSSYVQYDEIDFNPGNGVNTSQVFNYTPGADKIAPDYLVCFEDNATSNSAPVSRWFVLDWNRIRGNQYRATLHRDCIADNYSAILTAPMYIEKATPKINSSFIFNSEELEVSQIKTSQETLMDETKVPWIVGYFGKDADLNIEPISHTITTAEATQHYFDIDTTNYKNFMPISVSGDVSGTEESRTALPTGDPEVNVSVIYSNLLNDKCRIRFAANDTLLTADRTVSIQVSVNVSYNVPLETNYSYATMSNFPEYNKLRKINPLGGTPTERDATYGAIISGWKFITPYIQTTESSGGTTKTQYYSASVCLDYDTVTKVTSYPQINLRHSGTVITDNGELARYFVNTVNQTVSMHDAIIAAGFHDEIDRQYNGQTIAIGSGDDIHYYKAELVTESITIDKTYDSLSTLQVLLRTAFPSFGEWSWTENDLEFKINGRTQYYVFNEIAAGNVFATIPSTWTHTADATYDMFCMPYDPTGATRALFYDYNTFIRENAWQYCENYASLGIAQALASKFGGYFYDLQLVPYCPLREVLRHYSAGTYGIDNTKFTHPDYSRSLILERQYDSGQYFDIPRGCLWFCNSSKVELYPNYSINMPNNVEDVKVKSNTELWRINAPNWSKFYDFNPYKNNGVSTIQIKCDYRPQSPNIIIRPLFKSEGLYGGDYTDCRGLVITGDLTLSYTKDQYDSYCTQNKYFQQIFDRGTQNIEFSNKQANIGAAVGAISGTISGAASGAATGGVAGAIVGGVASAAGGAMDYAMQKQAQAEALDFRQDNFNFSLKTMQAQPNTLVGIGALTQGNTIWPTIEYYTCTDDQEQAFRNKLRYNGYSIHAIGTIADYILPTQSYIKGQLIRLEIADSNEVINAIASELYKGVFI